MSCFGSVDTAAHGIFSGHSAHYFFRIWEPYRPCILQFIFSIFLSRIRRAGASPRESARLLAFRFGASPAIACQNTANDFFHSAFHLAFCALLRHPAISHALAFSSSYPHCCNSAPQMLFYAPNAVCRTRTGAKVVQHSDKLLCGQMSILNECFKLILDFCQGLCSGLSCRHRASMIYPPGLPSVCVLTASTLAE